MRTRGYSIGNYIVGVICRTRRRCLATSSAGSCPSSPQRDSSSKATRNTLTRPVTIKQSNNFRPLHSRSASVSHHHHPHKWKNELLDNEENSSTYQTKKSATSEIYEILTGKFQPPISPPTTLLTININIATTPFRASF
ncbi:uncharacterized protein SEPMUDRAFT_150018 [Sphaerulina musiva SO2202]|uniref:Uncharacterized protein n=1 Tax=Sphaerulina musiva (strain SO2202) TaxID=692275 RepID=N1QG88_SPHMS|nr:uncharacterized protein SEPMUDRAFT_150018 [Sphaerulina musiva SO2202]EMF12333.1 hypothetical protein SEPMUDRAFT_150018 [Sphaerulina musiva SO2202]